jgi:hypothetical protein
MLLGILIPYSLRPKPRTSFKHLLFRDNLSVLYVGVFHSVDSPILVELNVLLFGLIVRVIGSK